MIRITLETEGAAFNPEEPQGWRSEAAWLLHDIADRIAAGRELPLPLIDYNGNRVGEATEVSPETLSAPAGG